MIVLKKINFKYLEKCDYEEAKKNICVIPGIGNKVADCILLFSLNKLEAFPLDTWMIKILEKYYSNQFNIETKTITKKQYQILHEKNCELFWSILRICSAIFIQNGKRNYNKNGCKPLK